MSSEHYSGINYFEIIKSLLYKKVIVDKTKLKMTANSESHAENSNPFFADINGGLFPNNCTLVDLFEFRAAKNPNNIALVHDDIKLTYSKLNERANEFARYLISKNVSKNFLVPIYLSRSVDIVIAILGILKVGAAYVPIDADFPIERLLYILTDINPIAVVSCPKLKRNLPVNFLNIVVSIEDENKAMQAYSSQNLAVDIKQNDLAYIIYTSGTTGHPKGVMVEHFNVINLFNSANIFFQFNDKDVWTLFHSCAFDFSVWEIWGALLYGGELIIVSYEQTRDLLMFYQLCEQSGVTVLNLTPGAFYNFSDIADGQNGILDNLRYIIFGGEALNQIQLKPWFELYGDKKPELINMYGITETTVHVTLKLLLKDEIHKGSLIGYPLSDIVIYVTDINLNPVHIGGIGELYVGGAGVARGYLNKPALTRERFIDNPFQSDEEKAQGINGRLYKTGDLVRYLADGSLEYIGRSDFQVKIRGYRIEPAEIESILSNYPDIRQSAVLAREQMSGNRYLAGYYISEKEIDQKAILLFLRERLPEYMIPTALMQLQEFPLTINGKLDRDSFPEPVFTGSGEYTAPRTEVESKLCGIFAEVLGLPANEIGIDDDFFRLGGDSIIAVKLVSRINKTLGISIKVHLIFSHRSIRQFANEFFKVEFTNPTISSSIIKIPTEQVLSFSQERLWFIETYEGGSNVYNIPIVFKIKPEVNLDSLKAALQSLLNRHEILRTLIKADEDGKGYQKVMDIKENPLEILEEEFTTYGQLQASIRDSSNVIFNLENSYPLKAKIYFLFAEESSSRYMSLVFHHIAFDGWSRDILIRDLLSYYYQIETLNKGDNRQLEEYYLKPLPFQFKDFACWQRMYLTGTVLEKQANYWKQKLLGFETLRLPIDKMRPNRIDYSGGEVYFSIDKETSEKLRVTAVELGVSLYSMLLSGFYILLSSYSNQRDIIVGTPVANRHYNDVTDLIGFFVNTLVVREILEDDQTLISFIRQVGRSIVEAQIHQDIPFEKLIDILEVENDTSRHPIVQVVFGVQSFGNEQAMDIGKLFERYEDDQEDQKSYIAKFDITTILDDSDDEITGTFNYAKSLFNDETINQYVSTYKEILRQLCTASIETGCMIKLKEINLLNDKEKDKILYEWSGSDKLYIASKSIHDLFIEQVDKTPDNIAVVFGDISFTFCELNEQANKVAEYLQVSLLIKPGEIVGICMDKSDRMILALLAIVKCRAVYVFIDFEYPADRISYILSDTELKIILTDKEKIVRLQQMGSAYNVSIEKILEELLQQNWPKTHELQYLPSDIACIVYTSGTTGYPKGVILENSGITRLVKNSNFLCIDNNDVFLQLSPVFFDASTFEIWGSLLNGAKLVLYQDIIGLVSNPKLFGKILEDNHITILWLTKTLFDSLYLIDQNIFDCIDHLLVGGEALNKGLIDKITKQKDSHFELINGYGPTENSTFTSTYLCNENKFRSLNSIPIGSPISNTTIYILREGLFPLPPGGIGELYVGGAGVARGYLNKPALTRERFIDNPFQSDEEKAQGINGRLYKTGDLVRYLADGSLEYIGRSDFQVKIRGYRIEPAEIESILSNYPDIRQSAVLVREQMSGNRYLAGYYISEKEIDQKAILLFLRERLPEYMIPTALMQLQEFPLTINGKLDRDSFPEPVFTGSGEYTAPRTEVESKLCGIFAEVLGLPANEIGIDDDFFRLGGDSIVAIQLARKVNYQFKSNINVKDIFAHRIIAELSEHIKINLGQNLKVITSEQGLLDGEFSLLPIQQWFFDNVDNGLFASYNHYNHSFLINVPILNLKLLNLCVSRLIAYHDCLRLSFLKKDVTSNKTIYEQLYRGEVPDSNIKCLNINEFLSADEISNTLTEWQSDFDIFRGKLFQIGYLSGYPDKRARVFFAFHHLIIDTVSWRIICDDLFKLYEYFSNKPQKVDFSSIETSEILGPKGTSYRQWIKSVSNYGIDEENKRDDEIKFWSEMTDRIRIQNIKVSVENHEFPGKSWVKLEKDKTSLLLKSIGKVFNTQINDILLAALGMALKQFTSNDNHYIQLEGHGREKITIDDDVNNTVGWFTTFFPVQLKVDLNDISCTLINIKEELANIPNRGIGYGAVIGNYSKGLPKITFNYLGQFDNSESTEKLTWHISNEPAGLSVSEYNFDGQLLSLTGAVADECLHFNISGSIPNGSIEEFCDVYRKKIEELIDYLGKQTRSYLTGSDIRNLISKEYLNKLQSTREIEAVYLANSLQQGFIYHALSQGKSDDSYLVQIMWEYNSEVNIEILLQAWRYAQKKYCSLRLRFGWEEELIQIIDKHGIVNWNYLDLSSYQAEIQQSKIGELLQQDRLSIYDLSSGNLFRIYLIKLDNHTYHCVFSNHHSILDGWSMPILIEFVHQCYDDLRQGNNVSIEPDKSYIKTQEYLQTNLGNNREFWNNYLKRLISKEDLSCLLKQEKADVKLATYRHVIKQELLSVVIEGEKYGQLINACNKEGVTINSLLQYCWHKQLSEYGCSNVTVVGTTVAGRDIPIEGVENSVGLYINTLPLVFEHEEGKIFDLIRKLQNNITEISSRSSIDLGMLNQGGERLFNSLFVYENYPISEGINDRKTLDFMFKGAIEKTDYPLVITIYEIGAKLVIRLKYAEELFLRETINHLLQGISSIIDQLLSCPALLTKNLQNLNESQYEQIVYEFNKTDQPFPFEKTIHTLFEEQVLRTPDNVAVIFQNKQLTYNQLNVKSNQLAWHLIDKYKLKPDDCVALCLEKSELMIIAILAILKAGCAYIPIESGYPENRISYMLSETAPSLLITNLIYKEKFENIQKGFPLVIEIIDSQEETDIIVQDYPASNPLTTVNSRNLAYILYTSGTSGKPKGVMVEHIGIVNLVLDIVRRYGLEADEVILQFANYVFDISVSQIFLTLLNGYKLLLVANDSWKDIDQFVNVLMKHEVTHMHLSPSILHQLPIEMIGTLRRVNVGVEKMDIGLYNRLKRIGINIIYAYGVTEVSITSIANVGCESLDVGKPLANTKVYLFNEGLKLVSKGAIGELFLGGVGVSRGYINQTELTEERFVPNPFQTESEKKLNINSRLYKTGDLLRYLPNGNLEYKGRRDFQVKIGGYRIELSEIESVLSLYPGIKQCVVSVYEPIALTKHLFGYYVSDEIIADKDILNYLRKRLPDYMVPAFLIQLEEFPLTVNGKLDRKALPEPTQKNNDNNIEHQTGLESRLCRIFEAVLGLPINSIRVNDDFFKIGGNSITAIKLNAKINKEMGIKIKVATFFIHRTIRQLALVLCQQTDKLINISSFSEIESENQLLSFSQERLWFIETYEGGSSIYNIPIVFKLKESVQLESFLGAFQKVIKRHEVLRSVIKTNREGKGYQKVIDVDIPKIDIQEITSEKEMRESIRRSVEVVFNLEIDCPIRAKLFLLNTGSEEAKYMSIVIHHIAFDGWSRDIFIRDLLYYYFEAEEKDGAVKAKKYKLKPLIIQYKDFSLWQRNYLSGEVLGGQLKYWTSKLIGYETLQLATDKVRPRHIDYNGAEIYFSLDNILSNELRQVAVKLGVSLYSLFLSAYYITLSVFSNQKDILIGTPIANRHHPEIEDTIGCFVNMLVLRETLNYNQEILLFIQQVGQSVIEAQSHQDLPFEKLVEEMKVEQNTSRHPLFQVVFGMQHFGGEQQEEIDSLFDGYDEKVGSCVAKFDLTLMLDDSKDEIRGLLNYATSLFNEVAIECYISTYKLILNQLAYILSEVPVSKKIKEISYIDEKDAAALRKMQNHVNHSFPKNKTIQALFEQQVERTPHHIALVHEGKEMTYRKLNEEANRLSWYLKNKYDIKGDDLIAIMIDRSSWLIIAMLGVLKSGAGYVPIDKDIPKERLEFILEDSHPKLLIIESISLMDVLDLDIDIFGIDVELDGLTLDDNAIRNLESQISAENLAYVIYTSGTMGRPKGVKLEHQSIVNLLSWHVSAFNVNGKSKTTVMAGVGFDAFGWELWPYLISGAYIYIVSDEQRSSITKLILLFNSEKFTHSFVPTSLINEFVIESRSKDLALKYLLTGGDYLSPIDVSGLNYQVVNNYGPTENSVVTTSGILVAGAHKHFIGQPISNNYVYVLDGNMNICPFGAVGELHIGGMGLARGYINNDVLTSEKFIDNPFRPGERMYKTGDLARRCSDGRIDFIGRMDTQVKIRGYRIELSEIEAVLSLHPAIIQIVIVVKEQAANSKYLVGFYESQTELHESELQGFARRKLPEYMIPQAMMQLAKLPLTLNGKIDKRSLLDLQINDNKEYIAPRTPLELKVCAVFAESLGLNENTIGIYDDFFKLGGDSIVSIQLVSKLRSRLGLKISVADIFKFRTIESLSVNLLRDQSTDRISSLITDKDDITGQFNLLPIQNWFFTNNFAEYNYWNQAFIIRVCEIDFEVLKKAVSALIKKHDIFRLRFSISSEELHKNTYYQFFADDVETRPIEILDVNAFLSSEGSDGFKVEIQNTLTLWQSDFDIHNGPLYSVGYIHGYNDGSSRIFFAAHHLIIDTVSWRILCDDLEIIYNLFKEEKNGKTNFDDIVSEKIGYKTSSYKQWVNAVQNYARNNFEERGYWESVMADYRITRPSFDKYVDKNGDTCYSSFSLDLITTKNLLTKCSVVYHTQINDLLLTALALTLCDFADVRTVYLLMEGHGREDIDTSLDVTKTVGWFTSIYPLRLPVNCEEIGDNIKTIKELLRDIPNKGIGYGPLMGCNHDELPQIVFNYLGQFDNAKSMTHQSKEWRLIPENSGNTISYLNKWSAIASFNGYVSDGLLKFSIRTRFGQENTEILSNSFKFHLVKVVNYCLAKNASEYTPSDLAAGFDPYIAVGRKDNADKRILYMLPPGNGGAESYAGNLIPKLSTVNVIAFNNFLLHIKKQLTKDPFEKIGFQFLAKYYIGLIKKIQPKGPYNLFGWSFGGVLAFEIANQLSKKGDIVDNMILVDPLFNLAQTFSIWGSAESVKIIAPVNYNYEPDRQNQMIARTVVLFTAGIAIDENTEDISEEELKMYNYYSSTKDNHLGDFIDMENVSIIKMNETHSSWIGNNRILTEMSNYIVSHIK